jgi:cell division ATPase FtsA
MISAGLVLTGGACNLESYVSIARETFNLPLKISQPGMDNISGKTEALTRLEGATSIGMLRYCASICELSSMKKVSSFKIKSIIDEIKKFFSE